MIKILFDFVQRGRTIEAEAEFEKLLGGLHVKSAMSDLSKSDRGDESGTLNLKDIFYGRHSRGTHFFIFLKYSVCGHSK